MRPARYLPVLLVAALAACGGPTTGSDGSTGSGYAGFASCTDAPLISADPALYRDEPRYGNAEELTTRVSAWASAQPGFEQFWLDRDHHGWVTLGFRHGADVAALQEQVAAQFPGAGVVVVEVPYTLAELQALGDRVQAALAGADAQTFGMSLDVPRGLVSVSGVVPAAQTEAALRAFAGEPLCVDAVDAAAIAPEGAQPDGGDGWRLLGEEDGAGAPYRTDVATTDTQLAALWQESGLSGTAPGVDWQREIVVWWGAVGSTGCPVRLDDVVLDGTTLHGRLVVPGAGPGTACLADALPHSFVVAVERTALPAGPFEVQLGADAPPPGAPDERTVVDVDLSSPGAVAADGQIHRDRDAGAPEPVVEDGYDGTPPQGARYVWNPRPQCRGTVIGPIDGSLWRLADGEPRWAADAGQELALFPIDDELIVVSGPGGEYSFVRTADAVCAS